MDFRLSEEQELLQELLRGFVENECPAPVVRQIFDSESGYEPALWRGLVEMGVAGLAVPEALGGAGLGVLELALVSEVLGHGAVPGPFLGHALATFAIRTGGSDAQRERWLPRLASGELLATVALGEPDGAWAPEQWTARVDRDRVSGAKDFAPFAAISDLLVLGVAGGHLVLVERGAPGVKLSAIEPVDRSRRMDRLTLENAPCEPLESQHELAARVRDLGLVLLAADAFGAGQKLVRMAAAYCSTREQFGQPLAGFQAVKHQLADMALEIDPTRGLVWYAAYAQDRLPEERERAAALAKAHITDRAMQVARDAVERHGGVGFTWESDVQIWFKRVMFDRQFLGTPDQHRERAARLAGW